MSPHPSPLPHTAGEGAQLIDHGIATVFRAPKSFTGEDSVEFSVHGSPYILRLLLNACLKLGARLAAPGEFTQRAFLNGKLDLTQAEAVAELIRAKTDHAHRAAVGQLEGRLSWEVRGLRDRLLPILAHIEVGLDHSDENHDFLPREQLKARCEELRTAIDDILRSARVGKLLREGFRVAIVGLPNAGKSSLLNHLLREDRAIVTAIPGTTRDTLEEAVDWDGFPVVLIDTAGIREGELDAVERLGIARSRQAIENSDFVIWVQDGSVPADPGEAVIQELLQARPHRIIQNKNDLPSRRAHSPETVLISTKTGQGLSDLKAVVKAAALGRANGHSETAWLLNARHSDALRRTRDAIDRAEAAAAQDAYEECVALELKTALASLGEIIGETSTEDLLGTIFANFCVGK